MANKQITMILTEIREEVYKVYPRAYCMPVTMKVHGGKDYTEYQIRTRAESAIRNYIGGSTTLGKGRTRRIAWTEAMEAIQKQ